MWTFEGVVQATFLAVIAVILLVSVGLRWWDEKQKEKGKE